MVLPPCLALPVIHAPQVTPDLPLSRTQINFTVAIDFTASNGEWGRSMLGWVSLSFGGQHGRELGPHTSCSCCGVTLFRGEGDICSPQTGKQQHTRVRTPPRSSVAEKAEGSPGQTASPGAPVCTLLWETGERSVPDLAVTGQPGAITAPEYILKNTELLVGS